MGRERVPKCMKQALESCHAGFELVGDAEEARLLAALNKRPSKLTWRRRYKSHIFIDTCARRPDLQPVTHACRRFRDLSVKCFLRLL
jgi:hypothetical protein